MERILIMGAAGRDFHNFNVCYRSNTDVRVVAFTASQIPGIEGRLYPPALSGPLYPEGIPIYAEEELPELIKTHQVDQVVFAYSDVPHIEVMHKASLALSLGADFRLLGPGRTMLSSTKPVVAVTATRTGAGKSQTTRYIAKLLKDFGKNVAVVRHPMPYGDLKKQRLQRFKTYADLTLYDCTIEEREEYEPHLDQGLVVYAGLDYEAILHEAQKEADILLWDGGNNDFPFFAPDLHIVVLDPLRPGHETLYHPGETNLRMADVAIINKMDAAQASAVSALKDSLRALNPKATLILANSRIEVDHPKLIEGKSVLIVEDGPTLTHGQMTFGAGMVAAKRWHAREIIDPRPYAVGSIKDTLTSWPKLERLLPAMGYGPRQVRELEESIASVPADAIVLGTPIDLSRIMHLNKPFARVRYELEEIEPQLEQLLRERLSL